MNIKTVKTLSRIHWKCDDMRVSEQLFLHISVKGRRSLIATHFINDRVENVSSSTPSKCGRVHFLDGYANDEDVVSQYEHSTSTKCAHDDVKLGQMSNKASL